jgi:hypothetical protein
MASTTSINVDKYADIPYDGPIGTSLQATSIDAIKNVIKMYLFSKNGDYQRNITKGGVLFDMIGKQLTNTNAQILQKKITDALNQFSNINVNSIVVSLDIQNKMFIAKITFSDNYNKFISSTSIGVSAS